MLISVLLFFLIITLNWSTTLIKGQIPRRKFNNQPITSTIFDFVELTTPPKLFDEKSWTPRRRITTPAALAPLIPTLKPILNTKVGRKDELPPPRPFQGSKEAFFNSLLKETSNLNQFESRSYNGWFNNPNHPDYGSVDSKFVRFLPSDYEDAVYKLKSRPNPFEISEEIFEPLSGYSQTGKNTLLAFFGQHVMDEISGGEEAGCPPEHEFVKIPEFHPYRIQNEYRTKMSFLRHRYDSQTGQSPNNPRQQLNEISAWIDGSSVYGTSRAWSDSLRSRRNGSLKGLSSKQDTIPDYNDVRLPLKNPALNIETLLPVERLFRLGNRNGNENPYLLSIGFLWFRFHNGLANEIQKRNLNWSDEKIFQEARKWLIAIYQKIVIYDWLPGFLGEQIEPYQKYRVDIDPGISQEFQSAAKYFYQTLAPEHLQLGREEICEVSTLLEAKRICNSFWNSEKLLSSVKLETILRGMLTQSSGKDDANFNEDFRDSYYGSLLFSRQDRVALNIQTGRDHGLPDYLTVRKMMGLKTVSNYKEMAELCSNADPIIFSEILPKLYGEKIDNIDLFVGGILETETSGPGELFRAIFKEQFTRIRDADRFWFENDQNGLFSSAEIDQIKSINLYDVIRAVTSIDEKEIQLNVFRLPSISNLGISSDCKIKLGLSDYRCFNIIKNVTEICHHLVSPEYEQLESCKDATSYDFFEGSATSLILTFVSCILFILVCVGVLALLVKERNQKCAKSKQQSLKRFRLSMDTDSIIATEWIGQSDGKQKVVVQFGKNKSISVQKLGGPKTRSIDLSHVKEIELKVSTSRDYLLIKVERECDLVLKFGNVSERDHFISELETFLGGIGLGRKRMEIAFKNLLEGAITKRKRQKQLESFFRTVIGQAFKIDQNSKEPFDSNLTNKEAIYMELTIHEFAQALSLRSEALFVQQMFAMIDNESKGYITFREFLDVIVLFAHGSVEKKMKLMFDMYDINRTGTLTRCDFEAMIKSLLELSNHTLPGDQLEELVASMFAHAQLEAKDIILFEDFQHIMSDYKEELGYVQLSIGVPGSTVAVAPKTPKMVRRHSAITRAEGTLVKAYSQLGSSSNSGEEKAASKSHIRIETTSEQFDEDGTAFTEFIRYIENNKIHIFWTTLFTIFMFGLFVERYFFALGREASGLRRISGHWVSVARGSASSLMFAYAVILLTMCRNVITVLRETFLHRFIPFDAAVSFHKYLALWGLVFSVVHTIGHALNFYHITTQTADDLTCLFRDFYHGSDVLPKFHYWCFQTITGLTGVLLVAVLIVIYVFAVQYSRRKIFKAFWLTHNLYPIFYILMILHGLGRVVQDPIFYYFFLGPVCVFVLDRLVSVSRKNFEISIVKAVPHPSDVLQLEFKKPENFQYRSGQWVRISCPILLTNEFHPFTLSSAPHEKNLSLHIRAVGPWTTNLRKALSPERIMEHAYPKIFLDGPYGEGHQDWFQYEIAVLVGGGIGVTPFASILKDIAYRSSLGTKIPCKKVYFLWVTRTEKHFEWLTDIIRDVEEKDGGKLVSVHIFITQFYQKFDLRTTMVYICERHFQRISGRSLFTGLKSLTHFGRPDVKLFLSSLQEEYPTVRKVGVFSCGPPLMTHGVQDACVQMNKKEGIVFTHHFENF